MKYQTEYQRNYQRRAAKKLHELPVEEQKLNEVSVRRSASSPSRRRGRSVPSSPDRYNRNKDNDFAVIGPNDKFSQSQLYRLKEPVKDVSRVAKSQEFAILGRNAKFSDNVVYPLRKPVLSDSPRVVVRRRRKSESHSCGIQTDLNKSTNASGDPRYRRDNIANRRRNTPQSEYKDKYDSKRLSSGLDRAPIDDSKSRDRRSDPKLSSSAVDLPTKTSVAVNTPARVRIDVNQKKQKAHRPDTSPSKRSRPKQDETTEYRTRYKPTVIDPQQQRKQKSFEAEHADQRRPREEPPKVEYAQTDDEGTGGNVDFGNEFRQKYPHGKLRRWKSEYQSTYKPFWRFDYKNGKWYKDSSADEKGFNPNLFWYKELMATRKQADEFRSKAETDHFNPDHTLQLQGGYGTADKYRAWDMDNDDDDTDSVISVDRDLERERLEGERRRERDAQRNEHERIQSEKKKKIKKPTSTKTDQVAQTDHQVERVIYIDEPAPKQPSVATKAFVRNLGSSSVQQHMSWDSESLYSQQSNSDIDFKSNIARDLHRKHYGNENSTKQHSGSIRRASPKKQESRGTGTHSPLPSERQQKNQNNGYTSPKVNERTNEQHEKRPTYTRPATSHPEPSNAPDRSQYDTYPSDKHPHSSMNEYCSYPASRFKDEVTDYYYNDSDNNYQSQSGPTPKSSFQQQPQARDDHYNRTYNTRPKDDDVLSVNSNRSLSSSCSLASQTLERAHKNMNKYWGENSAPSPKKTYSAKH